MEYQMPVLPAALNSANPTTQDDFLKYFFLMALTRGNMFGDQGAAVAQAESVRDQFDFQNIASNLTAIQAAVAATHFDSIKNEADLLREINALRGSLSECCCDMKSTVLEAKYDLARDIDRSSHETTRNIDQLRYETQRAIDTSTREIVDVTRTGDASILSKLCEIEHAHSRDELAKAQLEVSNLKQTQAIIAALGNGHHS